MIPIKDENPRLLAPIVTVGLIVINVAVFAYEVRVGYTPVISRYGLVPSVLMQFRDLETLLTSMFLHGDFLHLGGNMLYLWIFGDNIEGYLGHARFILFYLICGFAAVTAHVYLGGVSDIPMVGASGAISGVLGGYLIKYPRARVVVVLPVFFFLMVRRIPAFFVLGFWFMMQLFSGLLTLRVEQGGIAFWAHVGGFAAGLILINVFSGNRRVVSYG